MSPLLSNVLLTELDRNTRAPGCRFCRYADHGVPRRRPAERKLAAYPWPRNHCTGGGSKPPTTTAFKRGGGKRAEDKAAPGRLDATSMSEANEPAIGL